MTLSVPIGLGSRAAVSIAARYANRHGLIAGATGAGKSVTLMTLAEGFSRIGAPSFVVDVKGDLAKLASCNPVRHLEALGAGASGARLTLRLDSIGAEMIARALSLSDIQAGALDVAFELARIEGLPLATLADFRALLARLGRDHRAISAQIGLVAPSSVAAVQRALIGLARQGAAELFAAESFDVADLLATAPDGRGVITLLDARRLMLAPSLYSVALLHILWELYTRLPEVGDLAAPRLALFLDEAHIIFADMPAALLQRFERAIRLIRSKGVGVYFASQLPSDIPGAILGQLANRIQHGLRGATLADQRAIRAAAETLPINPAIDAAGLIGRLGVGQALVSVMGDDGAPTPAELVNVGKPACLSAPMPAAPIGPDPDLGCKIPPVIQAGASRHVGATLAAAVTMAGAVGAAGLALKAFLGL